MHQELQSARLERSFPWHICFAYGFNLRNARWHIFIATRASINGKNVSILKRIAYSCEFTIQISGPTVRKLPLQKFRSKIFLYHHLLDLHFRQTVLPDGNIRRHAVLSIIEQDNPAQM